MLAGRKQNEHIVIAFSRVYYSSHFNCLFHTLVSQYAVGAVCIVVVHLDCNDAHRPVTATRRAVQEVYRYLTLTLTLSYLYVLSASISCIDI